MQGKTKVSLSSFEFDLVSDPKWLLAKNDIIEKIYERFGALASAYQEILAQPILPEAVTAISPKIARGEKYEGLPWVMLDYPRKFSDGAVFAVRTFFWWGHFFSITLHLSGSYMHAYLPRIQNAFEAGLLNDAFISCGADAWQHHFRSENMLPMSDALLKRTAEVGFLKIGFNTPIKAWDNADAFLLDHFKRLLQILSA